MASFVFNISKGKVRYYTELPAANDALILIPLEASGLEADSTLKDYDDVASLLAGSTNEQTTAGRKTITAGIVATVDDTNDWVDVDFPDPVYTSVPSSAAVGAWLIAYDPDTTGGTDSSLIPLTKHDLAWTPDGNTFTLQIGTGFYRAQ